MPAFSISSMRITGDELIYAVSAIISALGALLFFAVGVILFSDLFRRKKPPVNPAETKDEEA